MDRALAKRVLGGGQIDVLAALVSVGFCLYLDVKEVFLSFSEIT